MKPSGWSFLLLACGLLGPLKSQTRLDLSRYLAGPHDVGSARAVAMPGAVVVMGADPQAAVVNPAGLGLYNRHVLSTTFGVYGTRLRSPSIHGEAGPRPEFSDLSLTFLLNEPAAPADFRGPWVMNISWQKRTHYLSRLLRPLSSSVLSYWKTQMDGYAPDAFYEGTPFALTLRHGVWQITDSTYWTYRPRAPFDSVAESYYRLYTGNARHLFNAAIGRQVLPGLFVGGALQIPYDVMNTEEQISHYYQSDEGLHYFRYRENAYSRGTGFRLGGGFIWSPTCFLRIGASVYSPAWIWVKDSFTFTLQAGANPPQPDDSTLEAPPALWKYRLTLPPQARLSVGLIDGSVGAFTVGWRYVPKHLTRVAPWDTDDPLFDSLNHRVPTNPKANHAFSAAAELKYGPLRLRGGIRYGLAGYRHVSFGIGYHTLHWYVDAALYATQDPRLPFDAFEGWNDGSLIPSFKGDQLIRGVSVSVGLR